MTLLRLAFKNLLGAKLRTWLNVIVLSLGFALIVFAQGLYEGMNRQAEEAMIEAEIGGGQIWHPAYDPYDPLTLLDAHGPVPAPLAALEQAGRAAAVLVVQGTIYPQGRLTPVLVKGIAPGQSVLGLPTASLEDAGAEAAGEIPAFIGGLMARNSGLRDGDRVVLQWRDARGTYDAREIRIVRIMSTPVQTVDAGQIWVPLARLREMAGMPGEATFVVLGRDVAAPPESPPWVSKNPEEFLIDLRAMVESKRAGGSIFYVFLLSLALLAIFDTQVLSIFHRRREIGTLIALGLTRAKVIVLFTLEGFLTGVLAMVAAALYGAPLMAAAARGGWKMPAGTESYGFALGERLFPVYGPGLVLGTALLVLAATTLVSFLPTRRIARLKPTDALKGRLT